ncbi:50S ribosomal protein L6, partial [Bacillus haikouensis]|uniref:50S ribosomal protein L6 n=1 Tax=Bacillus haikouensis TaxID=1510468 RepID=UPI001552130C
MSRVGKQPIEMPSDVTLTVGENNLVTVKGSKGELSRTFSSDIKIELEGNTVTVTRPSDAKEHRALHGTT